MLKAALDGLAATATAALKYGPKVITLIGTIRQLIPTWQGSEPHTRLPGRSWRASVQHTVVDVTSM
jgi:hypothetical protein